MKHINDLHIHRVDKLASPHEIKEKVRVSEEQLFQIESWRKQVRDIILRKDKRIIGIIGPCSIHDEKGAYDYARRLKKLADEVSDEIFIIMRSYFEKPRTMLGWRGLVIDPRLDETYDIEYGIQLARKILLEISRIGLPVANEILDPIIPQYIDDLVSWAAIGARTTESKVHRSLASGLSFPVGFKNSTSGNLRNAVNAVKTAANASSFIGIDGDGNSSIMRTTGNDTCHLILRGGSSSPNYYEEDVEDAEKMMKDIGIIPSIVIDCSHANSRKRIHKQKRVLKSVIEQIIYGNTSLAGFMLESYIYEGRQDIPSDNLDELKYGVSVTDSCIGFEETEMIIRMAYKDLKGMK